MNTAIIVAAGSGKRFGSGKPKQFHSILGKPILIHTLERFEDCNAIDKTILVLDEKEIEEFSKIIQQFNICKLHQIIAGGETRAESVRMGFAAVDQESADIVTVHDGARPLVSPDEISKTIESAAENGAACLVAEVTDTIKEISNGKIDRTVDRKSLRRALTPQCFRYDLLAKAFSEKEFDNTATDECFLVERLGHQIAIVEGDAGNIKITRKEDLALAENLLREQAASAESL